MILQSKGWIPSIDNKPKYSITAIIYDKNGKVLSIGKNNYLKTHPLMLKHGLKVGRQQKLNLHAEVDAIIKCKKIHKAYRIVIFRYGKQGQPLPANPCPVCLSVIALTPIQIIEHT